MGVHDDPHIVWDEWVGMWISLLPLKYCYQFNPFGVMDYYQMDTWLGLWQWFHLLIAFVLFRFFDILKPFPIKWVDKNVSGGFGILIDDILAGSSLASSVCAILSIFCSMVSPCVLLFILSVPFGTFGFTYIFLFLMVLK